MIDMIWFVSLLPLKRMHCMLPTTFLVLFPCCCLGASPTNSIFARLVFIFWEEKSHDLEMISFFFSELLQMVKFGVVLSWSSFNIWDNLEQRWPRSVCLWPSVVWEFSTCTWECYNKAFGNTQTFFLGAPVSGYVWQGWIAQRLTFSGWSRRWHVLWGCMKPVLSGK